MIWRRTSYRKRLVTLPDISNENEKVIKAEDTFLTEEFSQMAIQEWFNAEQEYNLFRSTNSQQTWSEIGFLLQ